MGLRININILLRANESMMLGKWFYIFMALTAICRIVSYIMTSV